jgi:hypothetical protein
MNGLCGMEGVCWKDDRFVGMLMCSYSFLVLCIYWVVEKSFTTIFIVKYLYNVVLTAYYFPKQICTTFYRYLQ